MGVLTRFLGLESSRTSDVVWRNALRVRSIGRTFPMQPRPKVVVEEESITVFGVPRPLDPHRPTPDEMRRTLDVLREVYPTDLRTSVEAIGLPLAAAVLVLEHAALDRGVALLLALPSDNPVVCYELARVAIVLGDLCTAELALRACARLAGGHFAIGDGPGGTHTATLLGEIVTARERERRQS
jgi:hypothetical protein